MWQLYKYLHKFTLSLADSFGLIIQILTSFEFCGKVDYESQIERAEKISSCQKPEWKAPERKRLA